MSDHPTFGELFKKYRLKSQFLTLSLFGNALAQEGFVYEDSIYSHWQKNIRVPKNRKLLLAFIKIFIKHEGMASVSEANAFLESAGQGYLTTEEQSIVTKNPLFQQDLITPLSALSFLLTTIQSKQIVRTGWKVNKIPNPESVAEHSFQLCVIAMVFAHAFNIDQEKLMKMAIIHDLGEIFTGDLVWSRGNIIDVQKRKEKEIAESKGIDTLFAKLGTLSEYKTIFREMVARKSPEAEIFWQLDKLEMAIQALYYEQKTGIILEEFFINTDLQLTHPYLREIFTTILSQRPTIEKPL